MLEAVLVSSRFLHVAALMVLFGGLLFPVYAHPGRFDVPLAWSNRWLHSVTASAALLALLSGVFWLLCVAAMMGGTPQSAFARDVLWSVLTETRFGAVWALRLAFLAVLLGMTRIVSVTQRLRSLKLVIGAGVLASLAGVGHTQVNDGMARLVQMGSDGAHLLAAGAWLGGLLPLAYLLALAHRQPSQEHAIDAGAVLRRFSGMGLAAVAVLIGSGLINSWFLVGSLAGLATTPYGQLLLVKLCLFAGMLTLAASNRYWLLPSLIRENAIGQSAIWLSRLRRHVLGEQALGLFVILIVSVLGTMQPAAGSARDGGAPGAAELDAALSPPSPDILHAIGAQGGAAIPRPAHPATPASSPVPPPWRPRLHQWPRSRTGSSCLLPCRFAKTLVNSAPSKKV